MPDVKEMEVSLMIKPTLSLAKFFEIKGLKKELTLLYFGHAEVFTPELEREYTEWVQTDEGRSYLKGGTNYKEDNK